MALIPFGRRPNRGAKPAHNMSKPPLNKKHNVNINTNSICHTTDEGTVCALCRGSGIYDGSICPPCGGTGRVRKDSMLWDM